MRIVMRVFFISFQLLCFMDLEVDIGKLVCEYIYFNWIITSKSQREFASFHGIEESTVRRIKNIALGSTNVEYNMTLKTLGRICQKRGITLSDFFNEIGI